MKYIYIIFFCLSFYEVTAQIPDITYVNAQQAANLLVGNNVEVSNAHFYGDSRQLAQLGDGSSKIGFNEGIVLTTGDAMFASSFGTSNVGDDMPVTAGNRDNDLDMINGNAYDVTPAYLEFDFVTTGTEISFDFVFASDEYLEYVNTPFNDAFGFFLSGTGISGPYSNGAINIAELPNGDPISINTVNNWQNSSYYIDNYFFNQGTITESNALLAYDGKTTVITIKKDVRCGKKYHLKIAICNTKDQIYDSGVFLRRGSLTSDFQLGALTSSVVPVCEGANIGLAIQGDAGWFYEWSDGQSGTGLTEIVTTADQSVTTYTVTATNADGCKLTKVINVIVHTQNNIAPYTTGINNSNEHVAYIQAGQQLCFNIQSVDAIEEKVEMSWSNNISNAYFSVDGANHEKGTFCWTPTVNDIGFHQFDVTVKDNNKCFILESTERFTIKVVCTFCPIDVYYENRTSQTIPLPTITETARKITAGYNVDNSQINGVVNTGTESVDFIAQQINLEQGFTAGINFTAIIKDNSCIDMCNKCCEDWTGFSLDLPLPNFFTPNNDGYNDYWYVADRDNPYCAFNAMGFDLLIKNQWGGTVHHVTEYGGACCPYQSPAPGFNIPHSSIYWDGVVNNSTNYANDGVYYYVLTLFGCEEDMALSGFFHIIGSTNKIASPDEESVQEEKISKDLAIKLKLNEEKYYGVDVPLLISDRLNVTIFPNPSKGLIEVSSNNKDGIIEVFSTNGVLLKTILKSSKIQHLDLTFLNSGEYLIKLTEGNLIFNEKLIIQ